MRNLFVAAVTAALLGCSGSGGSSTSSGSSGSSGTSCIGAATQTGTATLNGAGAFTVQGAVGGGFKGGGCGYTTDYAEVDLSNRDLSLCSGSATVMAGDVLLEMDVEANVGQLVGTRTYWIGNQGGNPDGGAAEALYYVFPSNGSATFIAVGGSVTFEAMSTAADSTLSGSFDLLMDFFDGGGGELTGTFNVPRCAFAN